MLEIDDVRRAVEAGSNFDLVDELSDDYNRMLELATSPGITDANAINLRLLYLDLHDSYIGRLLIGSERTFPGITVAYRRTIEQVIQLIA